MAQEPALEAQHDLALRRADREGRDEVRDDVVVVAGVERDALLGARRGDAEGDVEGAVAIERRDLDRDDVLDRGKARPEGARERNAADRRLEVEADQRHLGRDRAAVLDQLVLARALHGGKRKQHGVIAERARRARLLHGLRGAPDRAGDHDERPVGPGFRSLGRELEHGPVEPDLADRELGRMHPDREPARAGVDVVAGQRPLRDAVELAVGSSASGWAGMRRPSQELRAHWLGQISEVGWLVASGLGMGRRKGNAAAPTPVRSSGRHRLDRGQLLGHLRLEGAQLVLALEVEPEVGAVAEKLAEA